MQTVSVLQQEYNLSAKYLPGDTDYYRFRSLYLEMNDSGWVDKSHILDGYYSRAAVSIDGEKRVDRFTWNGVRLSEREGKGEFTKYRVLPYSKGFTYEFSTQDITGERFPVNTSSIPKTPEGFQFFVKLIDASTFDIIRSFGEYGSKLTRIGQSTELGADELRGIIDFPPLFTNTRFQHSAMKTTFQGITVAEGAPCAVIEYRSDDSHIYMTMNMMNMKFPSTATSYYWGTIMLSLETGKIVRAELYEHVVSWIDLSPAAKPTRSIVRRELTLEAMDRASYNANKDKE